MRFWQRIRCIAIAICMLICALFASCATGEEDGGEVTMKKFRMLMIGNSYSDDTAWLLPSIAAGFAFEEMEIGVLYIGGCSLDQHYLNSLTNAASYNFRYFENANWIETYGDELKSLEFGIQFKDWDIITMQQSSVQSGVPLSYGPSLTGLISFVKEKATNPNMKLVWNMTWAYAKDYENMQACGYPDQETMYRFITSTVQSVIVPNENFVAISPAGTAIQNARSALGDTLNRDGTHLTFDLGRYIAACCMFCTITGCSVDKIAWVPFGLNEKTARIAKDSVKGALKDKYQVTPVEK